MRFLVILATVFFTGLYLASLFLKFIRNTALNCLCVKRIKWGAVQLRFLDNKIAVELTGLAVQLLISPTGFARNDKPGNVSNRKKTVETDQDSSNIISLLLTAFKTVASYLISCFSIVLRDSILELSTIEGEQVKVRFFVLRKTNSE